MKNIKPFNDFIEPIQEGQVFEAVQSKGIDVENEQKKQTQLMDQIKIAKFKMSKIDANAGKKQFEKTLERSKLTGTVAKLTAMIAQSMNKESQALAALSKEQAKA
jgi:chromosome segregation ATPase